MTLRRQNPQTGAKGRNARKRSEEANSPAVIRVLVPSDMSTTNRSALFELLRQPSAPTRVRGSPAVLAEQTQPQRRSIAFASRDRSTPHQIPVPSRRFPPAQLLSVSGKLWFVSVYTLERLHQAQSSDIRTETEVWSCLSHRLCRLAEARPIQKASTEEQQQWSGEESVNQQSWS